MEPEDKINQLERTILELGTEIFRVKTEVSSLKGVNEKFLEVMKGLKSLLDEKGVISSDDFENAVDLGQAVSLVSSPSFDPHIDEELAKIKKTSH
ncbi:MAG: hypothetical protein HRU09_20375 [Oligoflexales bacterium]|nr:hypothetical protein [Oligoflexales bacterium]